MSHWEAALDAQVETFVSLSDMGQYGWNVADQWRKGTDPSETVYGLATDPAFMSRLRANVFDADPVYLERDMMTVWEKASETFEPQRLDPTDFIIPAGFMLLPRAWEIQSRTDTMVSVRAISWSPITITLVAPTQAEYSDEPWDEAEPGYNIRVTTRSDEPDPTTFDVGGVMVAMWHHMSDKDDWSGKEPKGVTPGLILQHVFVIPYSEIKRLGTDKDPRDVARRLHALWALLKQTVADVGTYRASAPFRKRAAKHKFEPNIVVVKLRRPRRETNDDREPSTVDWTHRWLVGGHWRWQPYPKLGVRKQIWISPYVKGPEDKPLEVRKARVWDVAR